MNTIITYFITRVKLIIHYYVPLLFYKRKLLASLYYALFSRSFDREHQAVLEGKIKHIRNTFRHKSNYYLLIRNIHRIEKGLLMRPRKELFARKYISETMDSFETICRTIKEEDNEQIQWFEDVLEMYFEVVGSDDLIDRERTRFKSVRESIRSERRKKKKHTPYQRLTDERPPVSYDALYALSRQRRSVRWFTEKRVNKDLIDQCIAVAAQSPSACNRQPFTFHIIDDQKLLKEVVNLPMGTQGYSHNIPVFIVVVGNLDAYFDERDRHLIYIDASLASMSFMLALETLGMSSCPINWADIEVREKKLQKALKLRNDQRPVMCMAVGYPDPEGMVASSQKKSLERLRIYHSSDFTCSETAPLTEGAPSSGTASRSEGSPFSETTSPSEGAPSSESASRFEGTPSAGNTSASKQ